MTAQDIFTLGAALIAETPGEDPDMVKFSPHYLNILLQECLNVENSVRLFEGRDMLLEAPFITAMSDLVDYAPHLTRVALPYALAANYYRENGDNYHEQQFRAEYVSAVNEAVKYIPEAIKDVYA